MYETINEQISVAVIFNIDQHKVRPIQLRWNGRDYVVRAVDYIRKEKRGEAIIHIFSATDGKAFFELEFDAIALKWTLGRTADNEVD